MRQSIFLILLLFAFRSSQEQTVKNDSLEVAKKDSLQAKHIKDSLRMERLLSQAQYPLIKNSKWSGALAVQDIQEKPDPSMKYKLLIESTIWSKDTASWKEINDGLAEAGRIINLHIAAGVSKENMEVVIVVHARALNVFLQDSIYKRKFKVRNPNLDILGQFANLNVKLIACGQAMQFFEFDKKDFIPEVRTALSAKVVLSTYQLKGFVLYQIREEN
ncbi:MAG: hypothetical protein C5B59_06880 [Bacteroidetes bacterium]|nr:MAG: hypothetical protein C5B59_06880 [Bacteroidota bacterium]